MVSGRRPCVFAAGHFPPPVHGMAVATERFAELLEEQANVIRLDISGRAQDGRGTHHAIRIVRTVRAIVVLARRSSRGDGFYLGCDAGPGMLYTLALLIAARALRLRRYLHHHSYAYLSSRSRLMAAITRAGGPATTHVMLCHDQERRLVDRYPVVAQVMVVPVAFALKAEFCAASTSPNLRSRRFVLGHLSNLSVEKGLDLIFRTLERAVADGVDAELFVAGPAAGAADEAVLEAALDAAGDRARYLGPVYGAAKEAFFQGIDVFLFPTRYRNESSPIVVAEAMSNGVPVIAYRAGCLDAAWVGDGGLIVDPDEEFSIPAAAQVRQWAQDGSMLEEVALAARRSAELGRNNGTLAARRLVDLVTLTTASQRADHG